MQAGKKIQSLTVFAYEQLLRVWKLERVKIDERKKLCYEHFGVGYSWLENLRTGRNTTQQKHRKSERAKGREAKKLSPTGAEPKSLRAKSDGGNPSAPATKVQFIESAETSSIETLVPSVLQATSPSELVAKGIELIKNLLCGMDVSSYERAILEIYRGLENSGPRRLDRNSHQFSSSIIPA